jgi:hypothetical protein
VRRTSLLLVLIALVLGLLPAGALASPSLEADAIARVNAERRARGIAELRAVSDLTAVAQRHSRTMADQGRLHHNPRLASDVSNWQRVAENVGVGRDVRVVHDAFMASDGHRANILDPRVTEIGIGIVTRDGRRWQTQVFRLPVRATAGTIGTAGFQDVPLGSTHSAAVASLVSNGITQGCAPGRFCPSQRVTRAQLATFLARALELPPRDPAAFRDVTSAHPHAGAIGALSAAGVVNGCARDRFCPDDTVSRAQMASLLTRAFALQRTDPDFVDVRRGTTHSREIGALARAEVTRGCAPRRYCPSGQVTRAEMASFLSRVLG